MDEHFSYHSPFTQRGLIQVQEKMWLPVKCILTGFNSQKPFK